MPEDPPGSVLFACTKNAVRSPMAAALLRHLAGPGLKIDSAGVEAGAPDPLAEEALREIGVTLTSHRPKALTRLTLRSYDVVIALSPEAKELTPECEYWALADATLTEGSREQRLCAYRAVRDELMRKLKSRFSRALTLQNPA